MTVNVFGYLILINIEFYDFRSPFSLEFQLKRYINHSRQVLTKFTNTSKFDKNTPLGVVVSKLFSVSGNGKTLSFMVDVINQRQVRVFDRGSQTPRNR